ncbi:uncharacterized protein LOC135347990 [Halichondria panicea]|uniref:uncharacterized protein LOC135347990 n=1 Tax=Halichondria panicea TaxID=6063 RepID=UPI00312B8C56
MGDREDMLAQMKVHNDKFMVAFANNDPDSIGPLYTTDCKVMPSGQDVIEGREGCVGYFGSLMKDLGVRKCVVIVDEVGPCGETAYERTHFQMYKSDGSQVVDGKYVVIWKKVEGKWMYYIDIMNSNN